MLFCYKNVSKWQGEFEKANEKIAKVYELKEGRYVKKGDFERENLVFELSKCGIDFDFSKIWY